MRMQQLVRLLVKNTGALEMKASGIERKPMAIGRGAAVCAREDCDAAQSESEDVGGWLNSLSPKAFKGKGNFWSCGRLPCLPCLVTQNRSPGKLAK